MRILSVDKFKILNLITSLNFLSGSKQHPQPFRTVVFKTGAGACRV